MVNGDPLSTERLRNVDTLCHLKMPGSDAMDDPLRIKGTALAHYGLFRSHYSTVYLFGCHYILVTI